MAELKNMVPVIDMVGMGRDALPMTLEAWLQRGNRLAFGCGDVEFQQFGPADAMALYQVRNDPTVRPFMPSPEPVPIERHHEWVRMHLLDVHAGSPLVLVGRSAGAPVAFGLLKPTAEPGTLEIGVITAGSRQSGPVPLLLGVALFTIAARVFGAHALISHVNHGHDKALRLNRAVGLRPLGPSGKPAETLFRATLASLLATPVYRRCTRHLSIRLMPPRAE